MSKRKKLPLLIQIFCQSFKYFGRETIFGGTYRLVRQKFIYKLLKSDVEPEIIKQVISRIYNDESLEKYKKQWYWMHFQSLRIIQIYHPEYDHEQLLNLVRLERQRTLLRNRRKPG